MAQVAAKNARAVFITGAAGGIGTATTRALAERGYRVYAGVRGDTPHLSELSGVEQIRIDVTDPESVAAAAEEVGLLQDGQGLHAVINNAGIMIQGPLELVPAEDLRRQFAINVFGPAEVTRAFVPLLREGRGRLINISAPTARLAMPFASPISASKAALDAISDAARIELGAQGIAVVTVIPGAVETDLFAKAGAAADSALASTGRAWRPWPPPRRR
jgi:NAD(P)-dependent dehydrogenase (short-subunit alcohol dehydrogenase family)